MNQSITSHRLAWLVLGLILLGAPLIIALVWGTSFEDIAYGSYLAARVLASQGIAVLDLDTVTQAPIFILLLASNSPNAAYIGLIFSALGWSAAAITLFYTLKALGRPFAGMVAALLVILSPAIIGSAGTAFSWTIALGWVSLTMSLLAPSPPKRKWDLGKSIILIIMLSLHFDASTVLFALALLLMDRYERRIGWLPLLLVTAFALAWGAFTFQRFGPTTDLYPLYWLKEITLLFTEKWQFWLYIPFFLAGLVDILTWKISDDPSSDIETRLRLTRGQQIFVLLLVWSVVAIISNSSLTITIVTVTSITLVGLGVTWIIGQMLDRDVLLIPTQKARKVLMIVFVSSLLIFQSALLWQYFESRSDAQTELEAQAATWLQANTFPEATVFATSRIGYLAERTTLPAQMERVTDANVSDLHTMLLEKEPNYIVSKQTLAWDYVIHSGWFKERYVPLEKFESDYAPDSPITIWQYKASPFMTGENHEVEAIVADKFALAGYQLEPQVIHPGDNVFLTLDLEALRPVENGFITTIHLVAHDGWVWSYRNEQTPRSVPGAWWQPGQVIPERFQLEIPDDLPLGAYSVEVFWHSASEDEHWPVYRDGDDNILDRVQLGYVISSPTADMQKASPVDAVFSDNILLEAVEFDFAAPGELFEVVLYWDTLEPPDANYTVFVGLMDETGEVVAIHNGMPLDNQFPTKAFKPGYIVRDSHMLELPQELPLNSYRLFAGMYLLETGERLPVRSADGDEPADRVLKLSEVEINRNVTEDAGPQPDE